MKTAILFLALIFCSAMAYERLWAKGDVLLGELQNGRDELYIVMFYDSTNTQEVYQKVRENQRVTDSLLTYLDTISKGGEKEFPVEVFFSTVDAVDPYNANIIHKSGVDATKLDEGPTILALRHGKGFRQHGPKIDSALRDSVETLSKQES
mmetsp:Transcript_10947/g.9679  ORF Transcript_10947/g.9679 Transcript_10947/m.9679 type:complete len:151 (+) Transcript_10947:34-486(+)